MRKNVKMVLMALLAVMPMMHAQAQAVINEDSVEVYLDADLVSRYMWRGLDKGGISIQPEAYVSWRNLTLKAVGNVGFNKEDAKELNLTLGYEWNGFNIGVTDYWKSGIDANDRYFAYEKKGAHQFEANLGYMCQFFSLQAYTMFWGNDFTISGRRAYSTYAELSVPFKLGGCDMKAAVGGTFFESAGYQEVLMNQGFLGDETIYKNNYLYAKGASCVMASLRATRTLDLGKMHLPVYAELHANPYLRTAAFLVGVSIIPF